MIAPRDPQAVSEYYEIDRTGLTELEILSFDQQLFSMNWHQLHEELASGFQKAAHPATAEFIFEQVASGDIPEFDYKPCSRKCVWALADIGTAEAKAYLEELSQSKNEHVSGFAQRRLSRWALEIPRKGRTISGKKLARDSIKVQPYLKYQAGLPVAGRQIIAYQTAEDIVVYQAYKPAIADYAVAHQQFGGPAFSYNRMSWIKPNFLWMMYRCGWAEKADQERVLAIHLRKSDWEEILSKAVFSSFQPDIYETEAAWKARLASSEVRLQWDPDHDPYGGKLERKAIQIGMKGDILRRFGTQMIRKIVDITPFVKKQKLYVDKRDLARLEIPHETVFKPSRELNIGLTE